MSTPIISFETCLLKFRIGLGMHYIQVPEEIALDFSQKFPFRVFCRIRECEFPAAIVKHGLDGHIIQMGKDTLKKCHIVKGDVFQVQLRIDETEHGHEMPEEFAELLRQDDLGRAAWEQLTPGAQRSLLYYLTTAKTSDTRLKRSFIILKRAVEISAEKKAKKKNK